MADGCSTSNSRGWGKITSPQDPGPASEHCKTARPCIKTKRKKKKKQFFLGPLGDFTFITGAGHLPSWRHAGPHLPRRSLSRNSYKSALLAAEGLGLTWYLGTEEARSGTLGPHHMMRGRRQGPDLPLGEEVYILLPPPLDSNSPGGSLSSSGHVSLYCSSTLLFVGKLPE